MLDCGFVITVHDEIVLEFDGVLGFAQRGREGVEAALSRVEQHILYGGLDDVFGIAALYAVAIARGHVFNDGNKRTGLTCALTYLAEQGVFVGSEPALEEIMVEVAEGRVDYPELADALFNIWSGNMSEAAFGPVPQSLKVSMWVAGSRTAKRRRKLRRVRRQNIKQRQRRR